MLIKSIKKDYGNQIKILKYKKLQKLEPPRCTNHGVILCYSCYPRKINPIPSPSSLQRTKTKITDYTLANNFELFTTFTFNPELVDSMDIDLCKRKMSNWLSNQKKTSPNLQYLIVAEKHKSGRIHFHALFKNYRGKITNSKRAVKGRTVYNIDGWRYGFSTAVKIDNIQKVSTYMQKYITKDMLKMSNKKRFWCSRGLIKPIVDYNVDMYEEVYSNPLFVSSQFHDEYFSIYIIQK